MVTRMFVNLPVQDLARARGFYTALGFSINEQFSDDTGACVVLSEHHFAMILTPEKFKAFTSRPIADASTVEVLTAIQLADRAAVDAMADAAAAHGGREHRPVQDLGFMYSRAFEDPDGHVWEPFFMDEGAVPE
jgi:predicted lactoylglutathione lyase